MLNDLYIIFDCLLLQWENWVDVTESLAHKTENNYYLILYQKGLSAFALV